MRLMSIGRRICRYGYVLVCVCWSCLWSLSPDAAKCPWMCGLHFQSSLLGGGISLRLDTIAILEGLPVLFRKKKKQFVHCSPQQHSLRRYSVYGYILLRWAALHIFHHIFRALHQDYSLEWRMLAHNSTYPVHSYNKLREGGLANRPNSPLTKVWNPSNVVLPALTCHTSGWPHSSHARHRAASAGPWWYH